MSKRVKISFSSLTAGKIKAIDSGDLAAADASIKAAMKVVVQRHKRNQARARQRASELVLNA